MITTQRPAYYDAGRVDQYCGLSTDNKAAIAAQNGDEFYEINTAKTYVYDEDGKRWIEQPTSGGGGGANIPPVSADTAGRVLSNDGENMNWQEAGDYLPLSGGTMTGNIDMGSNRLLNVENITMDRIGTGGLYIGAVQQPSGTIGARMVGVYGDNAVAFVKPDTINTYVPVSVGAPEYDYQAATKKYVDDGTAKCVQLTTATSGQIKAYVQNGDKQDVLLVSSTGSGNALVRYGGEGRITVTGTPTADSHVANKGYVDSEISAVRENLEEVSNVASSALQFAEDALPTTGGTMTGALVLAGNPTANNHAANKGYVDTQTGGMVYKKAVAVGANSSANIHMEDGVYLVSVSDAAHKGLVCAFVHANGETLDDLVALTGWTCGIMPTDNRGIVIGNTTSTAMTAYITSIGANNYGK